MSVVNNMLPIRLEAYPILGYPNTEDRVSGYYIINEAPPNKSLPDYSGFDLELGVGLHRDRGSGAGETPKGFQG